MTRKLRWIGIVVLVLVAASLLSVYSYGRFAQRARGAPVQSIPADRVETALDRAIAPLEQAHPGQAGLSLIADNLDAFTVRAVTARTAGRSLDLQYYIWKPDLTGNLIVHEVLAAADRGVRVRLLLDDLNSHAKDSVLAALDRHPNIEVRMFNPSRARQSYFLRGVEMLLRVFSLNRRMHNKAWIADGRVAVVGGRNIGDEYFGAAEESNFLDADLAVVGEPVRETARIFDAYWNSGAAIPLAQLVDADELSLQRLRRVGALEYRNKDAEPYLEQLARSPSVQALLRGSRAPRWTREAHVVSDPPEKAEGAPRKGDWLIDAITPTVAGAKRELFISSPYFVPGDEGVAWMLRMRDRGVRVSVLTNSLAATDVAAVHGGYAPYRAPLLRGGVELYELMARGPGGGGGSGLLGSSSSEASLHTKAFMVDGDVGFVGSVNFDPRSINLNTEMGIAFTDRELTRELLRIYEWKVSAKNSYRVYLENDALRWEDGSKEPPRVWTQEPEADWKRRTMAAVVRWLPVESQL
ncbi:MULTISPECIES: phospholipase D family protein [unclassified Lysobacter]|uniref:phospholipase D family protein n=1 Tax=unclassified Lysobacter TaxID=2635362 RepID=UPI001C2206A1|nr:phospholipase D family protein [Lysobacter sp. MMG2]MBU8976316.1 phospholipase D family protein [Lysobacter sp. MMG2]